MPFMTNAVKASPVAMITTGILKVGDVVTVDASRARDGTNNANARVVILTASGQRLFAASSEGQ